MNLHLIDISVRDKQAHPRLPGRVTGHVRAIMSETVGEQDQQHELSIPVWANIADGTSDADVDMALMLKAASIIARLKASLNTET